jgi:hypothetical protein
VHVPVQQPVALEGVGQLAAALFQVAGQQRQRVAAAQDQVVVQAQPRGDQVQQEVDGLLGAQQALPERRRVDVLQGPEQRLASQDGVDRAQQPVELELEAGPAPLLQP